MIYSVFNWSSGIYDYYRGDGEELGIRPQPRRKVNSKNGQPLESVLPVVPVNAEPIGKGKTAKGRVAVLTPIEGLGNNLLVERPWLTLGIFAGTFFVGMKVINWIAKRSK